jgi:hypothetical protein
VRVGRVEPEGLLDELPHRWQDPIAGEGQPMGKPALLDEEAEEVVGERSMSTCLEDDGT